MHEIGHCLGMIHEQSRSDRDTYVTVYYNNIDPAIERGNFELLMPGQDIMTGRYDYSSAMHYGKSVSTVMILNYLYYNYFSSA